MTSSTKSLRAGASSASSMADDARYSGEQAFEQSRHLASQALDRAGEAVRDLRFGARDLASRGLEGVTHTAAAAQKQFGRYADVTGRYVSERPVQSALIAAAVGAVVAGLIIAARRRRQN